MTDRVVLAYSGGLDTSVAIPYLAKMTGGEVVAVSLDLGQGGEDMEPVRQRGRILPTHYQSQRHVHEAVPAGIRYFPPPDCQAPCGGGT